LPWYISFTSQAGGILPNAIFPTRLSQYFVMFGPFLVVLVWFVVDGLLRERRRLAWRRALTLGGTLLATLVVLMIGLAFLALRTSPDARSFLLTSVGQSTQGLSDAEVQARIPAAIQQVLRFRLSHPLTAVFLMIMIVTSLALLLPRKTDDDPDPDASRTPLPFNSAGSFVLLLILTGAALTLVPEFVYLRDVFGQRLNTVFKFYYAAWLLFSSASAYAVHILLTRSGSAIKLAFAAVVVVVTAAGLVYPTFATPAKMGSLLRLNDAPPPTLDGIDYIRIQYPADYKGILWLHQNAAPGSVVLEAVGGSYSYYARVSTATGLPTILGWPGHEQQWRGNLFGDLAGQREANAREIYNTNSTSRARELLAQYGVNYVFVGSLERSPSYASPVGLQKFDRMLAVVFRDSEIAIYRVDQPLSEVKP
jgi:YYY domain-containing protein